MMKDIFFSATHANYYTEKQKVMQQTVPLTIPLLASAQVMIRRNLSSMYIIPAEVIASVTNSKSSVQKDPRLRGPLGMKYARIQSFLCVYLGVGH